MGSQFCQGESLVVTPHMTKSLTVTKENITTEMVGNIPLRLAPGQTRPLAFSLRLRSAGSQRVGFTVVYKKEDGSSFAHSDVVSFDFVVRSLYDPHKVTLRHPSRTVSYTILRPPSKIACQHVGVHNAMPVMLALHGAGVEADSRQVRSSFDAAPDLDCWLVYPTGTTPWCGDDWRKSFPIKVP